VKHLVGVGAHPGALPGGKDDNGETALVGHWPEQWHGVPASASALTKRKGRPQRSRPKRNIPDEP